MNIYSIRLRKQISKFKPLHYIEIIVLPTIILYRNDEMDTKDNTPRKATCYAVAFNWLFYIFSIEFWCDRKKRKGGGQ